MLFAVAFPATGCKSGKNPELQAQIEKYEEKAEKAEKSGNSASDKGKAEKEQSQTNEEQ